MKKLLSLLKPYFSPTEDCDVRANNFNFVRLFAAFTSTALRYSRWCIGFLRPWDLAC